jgi:hypothetical protein
MRLEPPFFGPIGRARNDEDRLLLQPLLVLRARRAGLQHLVSGAFAFSSLLSDDLALSARERGTGAEAEVTLMSGFLFGCVALRA